ncbi:hypothetical protein GGI11_001340 [Coemansia sp. RSA 2049]|nr:hypothetical protein H4217_004031 [Coemansia sp. RSA 1939]KAJ2523677.1 hypothetical protein GGI11_001340 [Coemansia sp. RSA 2049]KAJ2612748.1 hypothetical protein EV177_002836 [Coemansia sp. RSA 1804]KAJ2692790.1 hypothetical protein GGH99_001506 [Coemansia sp. RSA 1285]
MPKKFTGENSRATKAKQIKDEAKAVKDAAVRADKEAKESEQWAVGSKKGGKAEEKAAKRQEQLARKREIEQELEKEDKANKTAKPAKGLPKPKTPAQRASARGTKKTEEKEQQIAAAEQENKEIESFAASNLDDALNLMDSLNEPSSSVPSGSTSGGTASLGGAAALVDRHPERRAKAAYKLFLDREIPRMREENPALRLSKIRDLLWKEWQKSPENPLNVSRVAHNASQAEVDAIVEEERKKIQDSLRIK